MEEAGDETTSVSEIFQKHAANMTGLETFVFQIMMDPAPYIWAFALIMVPLFVAALWASSVLLKEEKARQRKKLARKRRRQQKQEEKTEHANGEGNKD